MSLRNTDVLSSRALGAVKLASLKKANIAFVANVYNLEIGSSWSEADLATFQAEPLNNVYEIQLNARCVGFIMLTTVKPEANLINIAVAKPLQNLGIGKQALEHLVQKLKKSNVNVLHLEVRQHSPAARFYLRHGFYPTGQRKAYYSDGEDAVLMTKNI